MRKFLPWFVLAFVFAGFSSTLRADTITTFTISAGLGGGFEADCTNCVSGYVTIDTTTGVFGAGYITSSDGIYQGVFSGLPSQGLASSSFRTGVGPLEYFAQYGGTLNSVEPGSTAMIVLFLYNSQSAVGYMGGTIYPGSEAVFYGMGGQLEGLENLTNATLTPVPSSSPVPEPSSFGLLATGMLGLAGVIGSRYRPSCV